MKRISLLSLLLPLATLAACDCDCSTYTRVSTEDNSGASPEVTAELRGEGTRVEAAGDTLEVREGQAWVNGQSYGVVEAGETVHYRVENAQRTLRVGDEVRTATAGS
jgi:polyribonucleotide nucleotidyltransferase